MKEKTFEIVVFIFFILLLITFIYYVNVVNPRKCKVKGGIVVKDNIGIYEKCIYKGDNK